MKGVTSSVIFILVVIGLIVVAGLMIFWKWMGFQSATANELSCRLKQRSYCNSLINNENPNWDELAPKTGCDQYGIVKPTEDECRRLLK
jgi:hypothetical protein